MDGDRIFAYLFPHKPFIINFHNLALLFINKTYTIFGERRAKDFSVDSVPTSTKQWRRDGLLKTALLIEPTS
jgi:hypothetical protein